MEWDRKTRAMRESKDLKKLDFHELFADLKAYELELGIRTEYDPSTPQPTKALAAATSILTANEEASKRKSAYHITKKTMSLFFKKFGKLMRKNSLILIIIVKMINLMITKLVLTVERRVISLYIVTNPRKIIRSPLKRDGPNMIHKEGLSKSFDY